jgi:hypothetical protein
VVEAVAAAPFPAIRIQLFKPVSAFVHPSAQPAGLSNPAGLPLPVARWRKSLPPAPELPRSLWLTGGVLLLALLSYGFRAEVWSNHPAIGEWSLALLPFSLIVGVLQLLSALQRWVTAVISPGWLRLLLRTGLLIVQLGTGLLILVVVIGSLIALAILF